MKNFILILGILALSGCTNPDNAKRVLEEQGYTQIEITGFEPFACDENDTFSTGFIAVNPFGKKVSGVVCSGFLKNSTIRFK
jgi:hypothetical protein